VYCITQYSQVHRLNGESDLGFLGLGHTSAHSRYYLAKQPYIDEIKAVYRETVEAFLHIAALL
jgi:hypothetical protein